LGWLPLAAAAADREEAAREEAVVRVVMGQ